MNVTSKDGTTVAYDAQGDGPALILVDGALTTRKSEYRPALVELLQPHFTVIGYDRRGRGDSGDTQPYSVEREIDDIDALIARAGGRAYLHGQSSGGCLAFEATRVLGAGKVAGVSSYEAPWNDDPAAQDAWRTYRRDLVAALRDGRRGDAVALFVRLVGTPQEEVVAMRNMPFWTGLEALAPTLAYDAEVMGPSGAVPTRRLADVAAPVLAVCGGSSPSFMCDSASTIAKAVRDGRSRTLEGQVHAVEPGAIAPVLIEFFGGLERGTRAA
ncbi:MAG TPA: alpha/beta hydrolase [Thermoleophilia bacterium]|nr:alpha/beta hydrolase [Thermoleophilia bacterium]